MPIGTVQRDRYRNAVSLGQQASFDAAFAAIHRIGAGSASEASVITPPHHDQSMPSSALSA